MRNSNKLADLINLIFDKKQNLIPFLSVFRKDIKELSFLNLDKNITANIVLTDKKFEIIVNNNFIELYGLDDEDVLWILCHEISHFILDHFTAPQNKIYSHNFCNFLFDCQVNSMLFNINSNQRIDFFDKIYTGSFEKFISGEEADNYEFLLAPPKETKETVIAKLNDTAIERKKIDAIINLWYKNYTEVPLSLNEISKYLEDILPIEESNESNEKYSEQYSKEEYPQTILNFSEIVTEKVDMLHTENEIFVNNYFERNFNLADYNNNKYRTAILHRAIMESMFEKDLLIHNYSDLRNFRSVLPTQSRKELVMLATGNTPYLYDHESVNCETSIAIYIDFSISTVSYHKDICKSISMLRSIYSGPYYAFTNEVEEISYQEIIKGSFKVSYTDIEPVISHINKNKVQKALIITDGEFSEPTNKTEADLFIILFNRSNNIAALSGTQKIKRKWFYQQ